MGLFSGIFGKKKEEAASRASRDMSVSELVQSLEKRKSEIEASFEPDIAKMRERLAQASKEMAESMSRLEAAQCPSKIDDAIMKLAVSFRTSLVKSFNQLFIDVSKEAGPGLSNFEQYFSRCSSDLIESEKDAMRFVKPLREVFPGETKDVLKKVDRMEEVVKEIKSGIEAKRSLLSPIASALDDARALESDVGKLRAAEGQVSETVSYLEQLEGKKRSDEARLAEIAAGEAWREHLAGKSELSQLQRGREEIRSLVTQTIISMERPMKRLKKLAMDGRETVDDMELLDSYISNPFEGFQQDDGRHVSEFVAKISALSKRGELELEEKERRMFERASDLSEMLAKMRSDYSSLDSQARGMEERLALSEVVAENGRLNEEVRSLDAKAAEERDRKAKMESGLPKLREAVSMSAEKASKSASSALGEEIRISASN